MRFHMYICILSYHRNETIDIMVVGVPLCHCTEVIKPLNLTVDSMTEITNHNKRHIRFMRLTDTCKYISVFHTHDACRRTHTHIYI